MTSDAAATAPQPDKVAALLRDQFPSAVYDVSLNATGETVVVVDRSQIATVLRQAKQQPEYSFDFLRCLTGVDQQEQGIELIYSLFSYKNRHKIHVKTVLPPEDTRLPSITP